MARGTGHADEPDREGRDKQPGQTGAPAPVRGADPTQAGRRPLPPGSKAAELGCGPGYGTKLILGRFRAAHVDAVDLDPYMITRARRRLASQRHRVRFAVRDATDLRTAFDAGDGAYDAVFDFAIIHHIPDWRSALAETARVLKPGGVFVFEEVTAHALARPSYRLLFDHPTEDRFTAEQFLTELPRHGFTVHSSLTRIQGDYVFGAAVRPT
ncbi:class I SAM-dependent methyltransferase [Streptomyces sp. Ju416(a)]|uniref:class I SAM-dependent methyltransferase n=1 Tax=Streptomyces TaxID=1883 RepID=UPI003F4A01B1